MNANKRTPKIRAWLVALFMPSFMLLCILSALVFLSALGEISDDHDAKLIPAWILSVIVYYAIDFWIEIIDAKRR